MHHEFLPLGRTVNKEYYFEVMHRLCEAIRKKHTELWKNQLWILTITEVADDVGMSFGSCQAIFTDILGIKRFKMIKF